MKDLYALKAEKISLTENHPPNIFLQGFEGNPFARIKCRSFTRLCTGVCGNCRKERDKFKLGRLMYWQQYFQMEKIKSGGDPDILQDLLTPEKMLKAEILIIAVQKETRFAHEYEPYLLQEAIQERALATLQ